MSFDSSYARPLALVVDDEESVRRAGRRMLVQLGYNVELACDGPEAIKVFSRSGGQFDLVLLDAIMLMMSGQEALQSIRELDASVPVIMACGGDRTEILKDLTTCWPDGFVRKPYTIESLKREILRTLQAIPLNV